MKKELTPEQKRRREYYLRNKAAFKARYLKNRARLNARSAERRARDPMRFLISRAWRSAHPERNKEHNIKAQDKFRRRAHTRKLFQLAAAVAAVGELKTKQHKPNKQAA